MDSYLVVKTVHIISAAILFGTGIGIAFFMLCARFTENLHERHYAIRTAVLADWLFTLPTVILQPLTGIWLVRAGGYGWSESWLVATYAAYLLAGACWLPVVWIQIRLKRMARAAAMEGAPLPAGYHRLFRLWTLLGVPAFLALTLVFFLMVMKP